MIHYIYIIGKKGKNQSEEEQAIVFFCIFARELCNLINSKS